MTAPMIFSPVITVGPVAHIRWEVVVYEKKDWRELQIALIDKGYLWQTIYNKQSQVWPFKLKGHKKLFLQI